MPTTIADTISPSSSGLTCAATASRCGPTGSGSAWPAAAGPCAAACGAPPQAARASTASERFIETILVDRGAARRVLDCRGMAETWLKCSACKNPIPFHATHWVCSVSTCNRSRTRLVFCTVSCWDSHVAMLRHRDAWAVEARAPSKEAWEKELAEHPPEPAPSPAPAAPSASPSSAPVRRVVGEASPATAAALEGVSLQPAEREILIVVSKLKKYI